MKETSKRERGNLVLINLLDSNAFTIGFVGGNVGVAKLAMSKQFPNRVSPIEVLRIPKIGLLPARNHPSPSGFASLVLLFRGRLVGFTLLLILPVRRRRRRRCRRPIRGWLGDHLPVDLHHKGAGSCGGVAGGGSSSASAVGLGGGGAV